MKKSAMILCFLFIPTITSATPSVINVSGNFNHGNTITITGTGFGTKSPAKPTVWIDFEGKSLSANPSLSDSPDRFTSNTMYIASDTNPHSNSEYSAYGIMRTNGNKTTSNIGTTVNNTDKYYVFGRVKYEAGTFQNLTNQKFFWALPGPGETPIDTRLQYHNFSNPHNPDATNSGLGWQWTGGTPQGGILKRVTGCENGEWCTHEIQDSRGDLNIANGITKWWLNSVIKLSSSTVKKTTKYPENYNKLIFTTFWTESIAGVVPANGSKHYYDDIYMDSTWSRVMIGNASTFDACTHREPLIPMEWSPTSIKAYFNQGAFTNGQSIYLFVVDSDGNSSSGKGIKIGGTAAYVQPIVSQSIPNAPAKLSININ